MAVVFRQYAAEYGIFITARSRNKKVWQDTSLARGWLVAAQGSPGLQVTLWLQLSKCGDLKWYTNIHLLFISIFPKLLGLIFVYKVADVSAVSLGRDEEWEVCHRSLWISEAASGLTAQGHRIRHLWSLPGIKLSSSWLSDKHINWNCTRAKTGQKDIQKK